MTALRRLQLLLAFLALIATCVPARAQDRLNVVASFSILGDFVRNVGGSSVNVTMLVGPDGDAHVYVPTPADAKKIADAKLVIINGFGLEGWLPRLVQSAGGKATVVTATSGIAPLKLRSDADPHAWQSVANAKIYVANIRDALVAADPASAEAFKTNANAYLAKLDALDRAVREDGQVGAAAHWLNEGFVARFTLAKAVDGILRAADPGDPRRGDVGHVRHAEVFAGGDQRIVDRRFVV